MKRAKWVAGVVVVLAVGYIISSWEEVWLATAYEKFAQDEFVGYGKVISWLPGRDSVTPPQVCVVCAIANGSGEHLHCFDGSYPVFHRGEGIFFFNADPQTPDAIPFRCICPHPAHTHDGPLWVRHPPDLFRYIEELKHGKVARGSVVTVYLPTGEVKSQERHFSSKGHEPRTSPPWWPHPPLIDMTEFEE